jgi:hypothetical protein
VPIYYFYEHYCYFVVTTTTITGKLYVMVITHSTFSLLDHQDVAAQGRANEENKWGMMWMGHARMGAYGHKMSVTFMGLSSNNIPRQFSNLQRGLSLVMNPPPNGEKLIALTITKVCTTTTTPDVLYQSFYHRHHHHPRCFVQNS